MAGFIEFRVDGDADPYMICFYSTLNYRLADGSTLGIEQEAAWCEQCRLFGVVEIIPSVEELRARVQELQAPTQLHYFIFRTESAIKREIEELGVRLKWRQSRNSPARCLACGSTTIAPARFGEDDSCEVNGKRLVRTGQGFADTADWIAEFSSEGIAIPTRG